MRPKRPISLFFLAVLVSAPVAAQTDLSAIDIKVAHVAGSVYMLEGWGGNIGVSVGDDGILIVDDELAPLAGKIRAALGELGDGKVQFVLNTHWHHDHTDGNKVFGREAPIIAHTNVRRRLSIDQQIRGQTYPALPSEALPVITFDDRLSIHFNGEEIRVVHYPGGHTDGDAVVFFTGSNVVHAGDLLFSGLFPLVDLASGGDVESLIRNVAALLAELPEEVQIIPGHGPLSTVADLREYQRMLVETTEIVSARMAAGQSLEEIRKAGLPAEWTSYDWSFISTERWIDIVYRSLSEDR